MEKKRTSFSTRKTLKPEAEAIMVKGKCKWAKRDTKSTYCALKSVPNPKKKENRTLLQNNISA